MRFNNSKLLKEQWAKYKTNILQKMKQREEARITSNKFFRGRFSDDEGGSNESYDSDY